MLPRYAIAGSLLLSLLWCSPASAQLTYQFSAPDTSHDYSVGNASTVEVSFSVVQASGVNTAVAGFSMACAHDPAIVSVDSVDHGSDTFDPTGAPPAFFTSLTHTDGWSVGAVFDIHGPWAIDVALPQKFVTVVYSVAPAVLNSGNSALTQLQQMALCISFLMCV